MPTLTAAAIGGIMLNTAASIGIGLAAQQIMQKKPTPMIPARTATLVELPKANAPLSFKARDVNVRQSLPERFIPFGEIVTGGAYFISELDNPYLYRGILLGDGPIEDILSVYIDGKEYNTPSSSGAVSGSTLYTAGLLSLEKGLGAYTQGVSAMLSASAITLPASFRQKGIARSVQKMHYGNTADEHNSLWGFGFDPVFRLKGAKVWDPRQVGQSRTDSTTWTYSRNAALCILHYMLHAWKRSFLFTDIDVESFKAAADVCDVPFTAGGVTEAQYSLDGVAHAGQSVAQTLADMCTACGGRITYTGGKFGLFVETGARTSVLEVGDDDFVSGLEFVHEAPLGAPNRLQARYFDTGAQGQPAVTAESGMPVEEVADGEVVRATYDFPFTSSAAAAKRLAFYQASRARKGRELTVTVNDVAAQLHPMEIVTINSSIAPYVSGSYEVLSVDDLDYGINLHLREYPASMYSAVTDFVNANT